MDYTPRHFVASVSSNVSKNPRRVVDTRVVYFPGVASRLDSPGSSSSYLSNSKGSKRKWSANNGSLVFGLSCSSNSCATMSSEKEADESTVHGGLSINLHSPNEKAAKRMNVSCGILKGMEAKTHNLDLDLSLSTGPADSDVTTISQSFPPFQNADIFGAVQLVDDGSASSQWKGGPLVPPFHASQATERMLPIVHPRSRINLNPVVPNLTLKISVAGASEVTCHQQLRRNASANDGSLVFGLSCSSNSCATMASEKEADESTVHGGLRINLHSPNEKAAKRMNVSCGILKGMEAKTHNLDLDLSLSTGPADSDVTTVSQSLPPFQNADIFGAVQLVDDGSASSQWKGGPLVSPFHASQATERMLPIVHPRSRINLNPVVPNLTLKSSVAGASEVTCHQQLRRNASVKICQFHGCTRGARGASGLCIAHGGGRRCQRAGCQKGAEGKTVLCKAHGGGRRCQHLGCTKSAEGRTDYCIGHGGGKRCSHDGCNRAARGKSGRCIGHGGGKRCKMENCSKSAEGISGLCISHGGGRRCQYPGCMKGAQGNTMLCKAHGGGKRCTFLGCIKGAEGSTPFCKGHGGGKRCSFEGGCPKSVHGGTLFCVNHGGGKRCAVPECTKSARGRTNFCVRHGGGKRCKSEGCQKSAQGKTDFCKAHGGGKRCSWGQLGSEFGGNCGVPCDKFARGKSGLCVAHSARVPMHQLIPMQVPSLENLSVGNALGHLSLSEGRVHNGNLMAMLMGNTNFGAGRNDQVAEGESEPGEPYHMPHSWV